MADQLIDYVNYFLVRQNSIDTVYEFFGGKYSKDEINNRLYKLIDASIGLRQGVHDLSVEWNTIDRNNTESIDAFYKNTENYIFDLLPWNACGMFVDKVTPIFECIKQYDYKTVVDFGGGIGFFSLMAATIFPDKKFYYADFLSSKHAQFAQFLIKKFDIKNVIFVDVESELYSVIQHCDLVVALDVLEHVSNLPNVLEKISSITNNLYHDSAFYSEGETPQHINTPSVLEFVNMMAMHNFLPRTSDAKHLTRIYLQLDSVGNVIINYAAN